jgi:dephospho-CoA kinase
MIVGLTGGIGSGKTTVGEIFKVLRVPVFTADVEAKKILDKNKGVQEALVKLLGPKLLTSVGTVDKKFMARLIFKNEALLKQVNAIVHPAVAKAFTKWNEAQKTPYVLREAAILFESGTHADCDKVIVVTAPEALRVKRTQERSGETKAQIKARMQRQWPQAKKVALADYIVDNSGGKSLIKQVLSIHENIIRSANA